MNIDEINILRVNSIPQFFIDDYFSKLNFDNSHKYHEILNQIRDKNVAHHGSLSKVLKKKGIKINDVIFNFTALQEMWLRNYSNGEKLSHKEILFKQIEYYKPSVIFIYAGAFIDSVPKHIRNEIRDKFKFVKCITGIWGDHIIGGFPKLIENFNDMQLLFTNCIPMAEQLKKNNINAYHLGNCFEKNVQNSDQNFLNSSLNKEIEVFFSGMTGYGSYDHQDRYNFLKKLINEVDLKIFTSEKILKKSLKDLIRINLIKSLSFLPKSSLNKLFILNKLEKLKKILNESILFKDDKSFLEIYNLNQKPLSFLKPNQCSYMPVDIIEYYKNIKKSKICLNLHREDIFDIGNIRSFEIPGNKGFLLTDKSEELKNYFEYGKHYIGFLGYNDCLDKINYF